VLGYRLYCLDHTASIIEVEEGYFASDEQALQHAQSILPERETCHGIEVWERARLIGRVARDRAA
jgi:hypothetical protein